jgi:tetrahydromethanopterin S-methyltransferase subunit E
MVPARQDPEDASICEKKKTRLSRVHNGLMCGARGLSVGAIKKVLERVALARRFGGGLPVSRLGAHGTIKRVRSPTVTFYALNPLFRCRQQLGEMLN